MKHTASTVVTFSFPGQPTSGDMASFDDMSTTDEVKSAEFTGMGKPHAEHLPAESGTIARGDCEPGLCVSDVRCHPDLRSMLEQRLFDAIKDVLLHASDTSSQEVQAVVEGLVMPTIQVQYCTLMWRAHGGCHAITHCVQELRELTQDTEARLASIRHHMHGFQHSQMAHEPAGAPQHEEEAEGDSDST